MKKMVLVAVAVFGLQVSAETLRGNWFGETRAELEALIERHRGEKDAYAVFDCDNTTVISDITVVYQIRALEELHFAVGPDEMRRMLLTGVPDVNRPLIAENPKSTADNLAADISDAYRELLALKSAGENYRSAPVFSEFAAKYQALYHGLCSTFGTEVGYPWIGYILAGYTREQIFEFERAALRMEMSYGRVYEQRFAVPADRARRSGVYSVEFTRGFAIPPENVGLFRALRDAGIMPHIVSASPRELVLAVFTDPQFGFGLPESCLFGYDFKRDAQGRIVPEHTAARWMPQKEGKVDLIRRELMPRFGGRAPVLVGGDSIGDYAMLTAFPGMDRGIIYNYRPLLDDPLSKLVRQTLAGKGRRHLLQGRDNGKAELIPSPSSIGQVLEQSERN